MKAQILLLIVAVVAADKCKSNRIVAENELAGSPSTEWDINGAGDPTIQGKLTKFMYIDILSNH